VSSTLTFDRKTFLVLTLFGVGLQTKIVGAWENISGMKRCSRRLAGTGCIPGFVNFSHCLYAFTGSQRLCLSARCDVSSTAPPPTLVPRSDSTHELPLSTLMSLPLHSQLAKSFVRTSSLVQMVTDSDADVFHGDPGTMKLHQ
jgi:hypothetical protein